MRIQSLIELLYKKALVAAKAWASLYLNWFKRELFGWDIIHTSRSTWTRKRLPLFLQKKKKRKNNINLRAS